MDEDNILGYDSDGRPIYRTLADSQAYGQNTARETGKNFDDAIKDLYWDLLGREPNALDIRHYKKQSGYVVTPAEVALFY